MEQLFVILKTGDPLDEGVTTAIAAILVFGVIGIYRWLKSQGKSPENTDSCPVCKSQPCKCIK